MKIIRSKIENRKLKVAWRRRQENFAKGYAVLELIFYISFFAIISLLSINSIITMTRSFKEAAVLYQFVQSGGIMERLSREIRQATDINSVTSTHLTLDTKDDGGAAKTEEFILSGTNLSFLENGTTTGNLNPSGISLTGLTFTQITTAHGKAVMIDMALTSENDSLGRIYNFYDTVVLRGNY